MSLLNIKQLCISKPKGLRRKAADVSAEKNRLVDNVSCCVDAGEVLAIIGPNGAGKSTLLKAIAGDWDYSGEILLPQFSTKPTIRARQLAVLPQFSLLNFPYQVAEVVQLGRIPHKTGHQQDDKIIDEALSLMDIHYLKQRLYPELSGGEKQRVQLARVLAQIWRADDAKDNGRQPRLLLLDEPTTALDLGHQQDLMRAIKQFAQQGVAVVMVLHDINLAARYADKMLALLCSQSIAYGSVAEVLTRENIKRLFGIEANIMQHPTHQTPIVVND